MTSMLDTEDNMVEVRDSTVRYDKLQSDYVYSLNHSLMRFSSTLHLKRVSLCGRCSRSLKRSLKCCKRSRVQYEGTSLDQILHVPFSEMTDYQKRERLAYLRYKMKTVVLAIRFLYALKKECEKIEYEKLTRKHN